MLKMTSILLKQGYTVATAMLNLLSRGARKTGSTVHHLLKWAALCQLCRLIIKSKYWMIHSVITCHSLTLSDYEHWQRESAGGGKRSHDTRAALNRTVQNSSAVGWWLTGIPDITFLSYLCARHKCVALMADLYFINEYSQRCVYYCKLQKWITATALYRDKVHHYWT